MNFYRRYVGDYQRDTSHLSLSEHGAYTILLDHQYATENPLPESLDALYRICRAMTPDDRKAVDSVAGQFFPMNCVGRSNPRADRQIPQERERIETFQKRAHAAAEARWKHTSSNASSINQASDKQYPPTPSPSPSSTPKPKKKKTSVAVAPAGGTEVWDAYSQAYEKRYQVKPTRNAKTNAILKTLLSRLPLSEAPQVAAFYVQHNSSWYVQKGHAVDFLLADAEKLRTEWATGRTVTGIEARNQERTAANPFAKMVGNNQEALAHGK